MQQAPDAPTENTIKQQQKGVFADLHWANSMVSQVVTRGKTDIYRRPTTMESLSGEEWPRRGLDFPLLCKSAIWQNGYSAPDDV